MKTSILIALFLFSTLPTFCQSNFEKGFERGYEKGYCLNAGVGCLAPLPPLAPLPRIGEDFNSYQDGYNRGFETGLNANSGNSKERQRYKTSSTEPIEYMQRSNLNDIVALAKILKEAKNKAFELQNEGAYQASINISLAGLKIIPRDDEFLTLAGYSYVQLRNYSEGLKYLKKAHKINRDPNLQELIGKIENGSYQKELQDEKPSGVENTERRNVNLTDDIKENMRNKNYNKALELSNQLVAQEKTWQAFALRGYIQYVLKNFSACITDYTKSISINPNSDSYFMRALSKVEMEDFYGALNDYNKIIEYGVPPKNSDMATIYNNKAYTLVKLKKYSEALPFANKAIKLNANLWYIWDTRGEIYFQLGYSKKCIEDMNRAISIKPDKNSYFFRGLAKIKMSNKAEGCQDLSKSGELGNAQAYIEIKKNCQ